MSATSAALVSQGCLTLVFSRLEGPDDHHCDAAWAAQPGHHAEPGGHGDHPAPAGGTADADAGTAGNFWHHLYRKSVHCCSSELFPTIADVAVAGKAFLVTSWV